MQPTTLPTALPTTLPSALPSAQPTPLPTPSPTRTPIVPVTITLNGNVSCVTYSEVEMGIINDALADHLPNASFSEDHMCDDSADDDSRRLLFGTAAFRRLDATATSDACTASSTGSNVAYNKTLNGTSNTTNLNSSSILLTVEVRHVVNGTQRET